MNPIPLTSPDGRIYAYACGVCHNVPASSYALGPWPANGPRERLAESSMVKAERCCTCSTCGARPVPLFGCDDCNRDRALRRMWSAIATCAARGFTTREQYEAYLDAEED